MNMKREKPYKELLEKSNSRNSQSTIKKIRNDFANSRRNLWSPLDILGQTSLNQRKSLEEIAGDTLEGFSKNFEKKSRKELQQESQGNSGEAFVANPREDLGDEELNRSPISSST